MQTACGHSFLTTNLKNLQLSQAGMSEQHVIVNVIASSYITNITSGAML